MTVMNGKEFLDRLATIEAKSGVTRDVLLELMIALVKKGILRKEELKKLFLELK